jgi:tetratricopeptide (TPR) repeat protein
MMMIRILIVVASLAAAPLQAALAQQGTGSAPAKAASGGAGANFKQVSQAADRARDEGRSDEAVRLYTRGLALRQGWKEGLWSLSTLFYQKEQYPEARDVLRRFVAYDPDQGLGWAMLGMSEFQTREYSRSLDHLQRAMAQGMGDHKDIAQSVFYYVAILLTRFERYDDSMGLLIAMVKSGQEADPLTEPIGLAALRLPFLPSEIPSDRHQMVRKAGEAALALETQHRDQAERLFTNMGATYPNEPGVHFLYGAFLLDERPEEGIRELKKELEISPSSVPARLRLAEEYIKEQKVDLALPLAQEAVKRDPKRGPAHMMLGEALMAKGDTAAGIKELETARDQAPQTVRIRWDLLRAYTTAGRPDDAKREKEEIEKLSNPGQ